MPKLIGSFLETMLPGRREIPTNKHASPGYHEASTGRYRISKHLQNAIRIRRAVVQSRDPLIDRVGLNR